MLNEPTIERLYQMRLSAMADAWQAQRKEPQMSGLAFDERFAMLVDAEHMARDNRRPGRLLKEANLRIPNACIEDVKVSPARGLDWVAGVSEILCTEGRFSKHGGPK